MCPKVNSPVAAAGGPSVHALVDRLAPELGGSGFDNLFVRSPQEVNVFATGDVIEHLVLEMKDPDRQLYLAIRELVYNELFEEPIGQLLVESDMVRVLVFREETEEVVRWIP